MSAGNEWGALGAGVAVGLILSAFIAFRPGGSASDMPSRPSAVPETAVWPATMQERPHWFDCTGEGAEVTCRAFDRAGTEVMSARYVARDNQPLAPGPFTDIIVQRVDQIAITKRLFVADGPMKFPVDGVRIDFVKGKRTGPPKPL